MFYKTKSILAIAGILVVGLSFGVSRTDQFHTEKEYVFTCSQKALEPKSRETRQYNQDVAEQKRLTKRQTKLLSDTNVANNTCKKLKKKEQSRCEGDVAELKAITHELKKIAKRVSDYESCKMVPKCGSATSDVFIAPPSENLCAVGKVIGDVIFDGTVLGSNGEVMWRWQCGTNAFTPLETCRAESIFSYGWAIEEWGPCSGGIQYRTVECVETYSGKIADMVRCGGLIPESSRVCEEITDVHIQSSHYGDPLDAANMLAGLGIITGYTDPTNYKINQIILRQDFLAIILKAMKLMPHSDYQCQNIFSDISEPGICAVAETALANKLISKHTNEEGMSFFRGTDYMTSYEMFLYSMKSQCIRPDNYTLVGVQSMAGHLGIINAQELNMAQLVSRGDVYLSLATFHDYFNENVISNPSALDADIVSCAERISVITQDPFCRLFPDYCQ